MKAAIVTSAGQTPVYGDFADPVASGGMEMIAASSSALSQFSKFGLRVAITVLVGNFLPRRAPMASAAPQTGAGLFHPAGSPLCSAR